MQSERCNMNNNGNGPQFNGRVGHCQCRRNRRDSRKVKTMPIGARRNQQQQRNCNSSAGHLFRMTIFVLLAGWLLDGAPIDCREDREQLQSAHRRLKTRSSLGDDEEELTLGHHLWASGAREGPAYSPPPPPVAVEPERQSMQLQQAKLTRKRHDEQVFDPFASLFEDYLREAAGTAAKASAADADELLEPAATQQRQQFEPAADGERAGDRMRGNSVHFIDEDEPPNSATNDKPPQSPIGGLIIDDDNGPSPSTSNAAGGGQGKQSENRRFQASDNETRRQLHWQTIDEDAATEAPSSNENSVQQQSGADDEIKLQFAWRSLRTNKCSKECGRGRRIMHLSCIDLKYNVRVQDELCLRADLGRPIELSDEPCNEIDCEPSWVELSSEKCQDEHKDLSETNAIGRCRARAKFKQLECMMTNRFGETVRLDEARCSSAASSSSSGSNSDDESSLIDLNEQIDKERNSILSNELLLGDMESSFVPTHSRAASRLHQLGTKFQRPNEPFYEPGEWSECTGAPCGQLGRRSRKVACRLYLKRSARFVELTPSRCQFIGESERPDSEEPCYMDCGPGQSSRTVPVGSAESTTDLQQSSSPKETTQNISNYSNVENSIRPIELEDETIYDLELARHVWRHGAWTKCSAECLGGRSESIVECWDKVAGLSVEASHCNAMTKPRPISNTCNKIPCAPEWLPGNFSNCSATCGSSGVRVRDVTCVRRVPIASSLSSVDQLDPDDDATGPWFELRIVPEEQCLEQQQLNASDTAAGQTTAAVAAASKPHSMEPCNRHDCSPQWQVGPWSECIWPIASSGCNHNSTTSQALNATQTRTRSTAGVRNRTVICVQEFASQFGPLVVKDNETTTTEMTSISPDLREAINLAAPTWKPGKAIQVPFGECYRRFHSVPQLNEHCHLEPPIEPSCPRPNQTDGDGENSALSIDTDPLQDFRMISADGHLLTSGSWDSTAAAPTGSRATHNRNQIRRRTITLKLGGRAQILEGWNVKIRCRVIKRTKLRQNHYHSGGPVGGEFHATNQQVEWRKDGVRIFAPNTTVAERQQLTDETDNSILYGDDQYEGATSHDQYSMMAADEPPEAHQTSRRQRFVHKRPAGSQQGGRQSGRVLRVRSWPSTTLGDRLGSFQFVAQKGGRFSLVKENTLRIKRLKVDDSGLYSCSSGPFSESIEINVVSRRHLTTSPDLSQNQASSQNSYN